MIVPPSSDEEAWRAYLQGVDKMQPKCRLSVKKQTKATPRVKNDEDIAPFVLRQAEAHIESLSKKTRRAMAGGRTPIDATLDLHGLTQNKAFTILVRFVRRQAAIGARRLLIVTGKGKDGASVLRQNFPRWCTDAQLSPYIAALHEAAPNHGGAGAFYLRLRQTAKE